MSEQLSFYETSEKFDPYAVGDIVVKHNHSRYVVTHVDSNDDGVVLVGINLETGNQGVVLEREIAYRSRAVHLLG